MKKLSLVQIPFWNDHLISYRSGLHVSSPVRHNQLGLTKNYTSWSNPWGGQFYTKMSGYSLFTIIIISNSVGRFST